MKYQYNKERDSWLFDCDICGEEMSSSSNPTEKPYPIMMKDGWFSSKRVDFCSECKMSLNMRYGGVRDEGKAYEEVVFGYDTFKYSGLLSFIPQADISPYWVKLGKLQAPSIGLAMKHNPPIIVNDIKNFERFKAKIIELTKERKKKVELEKFEEEEKLKSYGERSDKISKSIVKLLKEKGDKMRAFEINEFLKHQDESEISILCEGLYKNGEISRAKPYRYFIPSKKKKKSIPKKTSSPKSEEVDVKAELKKYKEMLDDGLITQEMYDAKAKKLLGL